MQARHWGFSRQVTYTAKWFWLDLDLESIVMGARSNTKPPLPLCPAPPLGGRAPPFPRLVAIFNRPAFISATNALNTAGF